MSEKTNQSILFPNEHFDPSGESGTHRSRAQSPASRYDFMYTDAPKISTSSNPNNLVNGTVSSENRAPLMSFASNWQNTSRAGSVSSETALNAFGTQAFSRNGSIVSASGFSNSSAFNVFGQQNYGGLGQQSSFFNSETAPLTGHNAGLTSQTQSPLMKSQIPQVPQVPQVPQIPLGTQGLQGSQGPQIFPSQNSLSGVQTPSSLTPKIMTPVLDNQAIDSPPTSVQWVYIDFYGQLQGPFSGAQMSDWYTYLTNEILIKRAPDENFVTFGVLKIVTGSNNPFIVYISDSMWESALRMTKTPGGSEIGSPAPGIGLNTQNVSDQNSVTSSASIGSMSSLGTPGSASGGNMLGYKGLQSILKPQYNANAVSEAVGKVSISQIQSPVVSKTSMAAEIDNTTPAVAPIGTAPQIQNSSAGSGISNPKTAVSQETPLTSSGPTSPKNIKVTQTPVQNAGMQNPQDTSDIQLQSKESGNSKQVQKQAAILPAPIPTVDPWKKPAPISTKLTIAQIKQQEQIEKSKKKTKAPEVAVKTQPISPPVAPPTLPVQGWAKTTVKAAKSMSEIQKEHKAQAQAQAQAQLKSPVKTSQQSIPNQSQTRWSDIAQEQTSKTVSGRFSVLEEDVKVKSATNTARTTPRTQQRKANNTISVTAAANRARASDELIHWAKFSFKDLAKDVDQIELLRLFFSLPAGKNAKEFIAESIYSYSRSLDGRRFAQDFLDKKKIAEQSMKPGETWDDVLGRFNPKSEPQDPSFKVVTKKRSRTVARPEFL